MSGDAGEEESAGITSEEWSRIREFADMDPDDRRPEDLRPELPDESYGPQEDENSRVSGNGSHTRKTTCRKIRSRMATATTAREVVEAYPSKHTSEVMRHAYGECRCSHDTPPTASPQIRVPECREFREDYTDGLPVSEIADSWARSENTVTRHIFGRCSHDTHPRRRSPSEVEERECKRLRSTYTRNEKVGLNEVACSMRLRPEVAATHLFGYCSCEHGEPEGDPPDEFR